MKTIQINHIAKTEGHLSFLGALIGQDFSQARIETEEGARLLEGVLLGRQYYEAPIVTARICGVCPIVHNLGSIKAMEQALNIRVNEEIENWRRIFLHAQWLHSHALHAFFLSFPDLVGIANDLNLVKKYPKESAIALEVRAWALELARVIGGRTVHPINSVVGGFNVAPDKKEIDALMAKRSEIAEKIWQIFEFVAKQKLPQFEAPANYLSLKNKKEYGFYDGDVYSFDSRQTDSPEQTLYDLHEVILPHERVKRVLHGDRPVMVGALARINNNFDQLSPGAKKAWNKLEIKVPCFNPFYNIMAQVVEMIHSVEEIGELVKSQKLKVKSQGLKVKFKPNPGKGIAVIEAPRGILYHEYELDKQGNILHCNIITPTTIFIANLERDLEQFLLQVKSEPEKKRDLLIKTLIRAYDPCISCATH